MNRKEYMEKCTKFVKKFTHKREVLKHSFSEADLAKVREIDSFLRSIVLDNTDEMLLSLEEKHKRYLGITVRVNNNHNEALSFMVNLFFDTDDFEYSKDNLYIAKSLYLIGQNKHLEVFFCTSLLKASRNEYGFVVPERKKKNCVSVSAFICDLDLPEHLKALSDNEIMELLDYDYYELFKTLGGSIIRSGGGLHLYIGTQTIDLKTKEMEQRWRSVSNDLTILFRGYGSDIRCAGDLVRLLRVPSCVNRKPKYGPQGKAVKMLRSDYRMNTLEEIEQVVDYCLKGGAQGVFEDVLEDIIPYDKEEELFYFIEWEDDIFTDEVKPYELPVAIREQCKALFPEEESKCTETVLPAPRVCPVIEVAPSENTGSYYASYEGINVDYKTFSSEPYYVRDILFFLANRKSSEGVRHTTIFMLLFSWYFFSRIHDTDTLYRKMKYVNDTFFKPSFSEEEILSQTKSNLQYVMSLGHRFKRFKNDTLVRIYQPTEEEKAITIGNYYEKDSKAYKNKKQAKDSKAWIKRYHRKKQEQGIHTYTWDGQEKEAYEFLKANPHITPTQAQKEGISTRQYYKLIDKVRNELGIVIQKKDLESCFIENPDISFKEFFERTRGSRTSYQNYRRKYKPKSK